MNIFLPLTIGYGVPRPHFFSANNKITQINRFGLIWDFQKISNSLSLSRRLHKHDLRTKNEPLKPKGLTFGDMAYENEK